MKIRIGSYTKAITKAGENESDITRQAKDYATTKGRAVLVKKIHDGRFQAFEKRENARGIAHPEDYEFLPSGRRAKKRPVKVKGGAVYFLDKAAGVGEYEVNPLI